MAQNSNNTAVTNNEPVVGKKKRKFKRLKGLITGKKKSKSKLINKSLNNANANANSNVNAGTTSSQDNNSVSDATPYIPDDASTVYGAELDASVMGRSMSSASLSTAKSTVFVDPVQVILLIMDPETRRFELLQLEFDSSLAKVSDICNQISTVLTEEVLQKQSYNAVITPKGKELERDAKLSDIMTGAAVVIAVPDTTTESAEKCAQMAIPILTNSKVHKMLISSGIKPEDLPEKPKKVKRSIKAAPNPKPTPAAAPEPVLPTPTPTPTPATTSAPVEKEPATPAKVTETTKPVEQKVDKPLKSIEETQVETKEEKTVEKPVVVEKQEEESPNTFVLGLLFAVFAHLFIKAHTNISSPLAPGSTLSVGRSRNSCGLLGSIPFRPCTPTTMNMGKDGILQVFQGEEMVFSLVGKASCGDSSEEDCVDGVVVEEDGTLLIGGEKAKAPKKATIEVTPWPFSEDVVYKSGIGNLF